MTVSDAIGIHQLSMTRPDDDGSFDPADLLRATLAWVDLTGQDAGAQEDVMRRYFHPAEHHRRQSFEFSARRDSYSAGRQAAKHALQAHCPQIDPQKVLIGSGVFGQPVMTGPYAVCGDLGVSISHSPDFAVALVFHRGHPMGVDVDLPSAGDIDPVLDDLTDDTRRQLDALRYDDCDAAALIWTARESLAKTLTTGMMTPLSLYAPSRIARQAECVVLHYANFAQYKTIAWPGAKGWLAITLPAQSDLDPAAIPWK